MPKRHIRGKSVLHVRLCNVVKRYDRGTYNESITEKCLNHVDGALKDIHRVRERIKIGIRAAWSILMVDETNNETMQVYRKMLSLGKNQLRSKLQCHMTLTIIAKMYIEIETAMIGLLKPWVFLFFQKRIYIEAVKRIVKNPDGSSKKNGISVIHVLWPVAKSAFAHRTGSPP